MSSSTPESIDELQCPRCFTKFGGERTVERLYTHDCPAVAKPAPAKSSAWTGLVALAIICGTLLAAVWLVTE